MIQVILTAALFTVWWAVLSGIPQQWRWPAKPFQCVICLPIYIAPVLYYVPTEILNVVTVTFAAPVVAWVIHGLLQFLKQNLNGNY